MGQKINPIALRLSSSTKSFDNIWYNDYCYIKLVSTDLLISHYITRFLKFLKLSSPRLAICYFRNTIKIYTFFCYPSQSRELKSKIFQVSHSLPSAKNLRIFKTRHTFNFVKQNTKFKQMLTDSILWEQLQSLKKKKLLENSINSFSTNPKIDTINTLNLSKLLKTSRKIDTHTIFSYNKSFYKFLLILEFFKVLDKLQKLNCSDRYIVLQDKNLNKNLFFQFFSFFINKNFIRLLKQNVENNIILQNHLLFSFYNITQYFDIYKGSNILNKVEKKLKYRNYLENSLSLSTKLNIEIIPFKLDYEWQSANYFADEIIYLLERRISFRQLKYFIIKQIAQNPKIRGIRIICSGRVGGKSKKAQRAKIESIKYGQTSLHVFSSKIDFAARTAYTSLGSTGIKVWLCYN